MRHGDRGTESKLADPAGALLDATLTRRRLLGIGGAAAAAGMLGPLSRPLAAAAAGGKWPSGSLTEADAINVNPSQFMPASTFAKWLRELERLGPVSQKGLRATGTPDHEHYVDTLAARLERAGVQQVHYEPVPMLRWTTSSWSLSVLDGATPGPVQTASYIPYSGQTRRGGVTAPLALVPTGTFPTPGSLVGKIAVFDVPLVTVPNSFFTSLAYEGASYNPHEEFSPEEPYKRPWFNQIVPMLEALKAAGASAVVGVIDTPPEGANGSYFPYDGEILDVPGLYVDRGAGATLKQQATEEATATLSLPSHIKQVTTRNIIGFIPGANSDQLVTLHSHTDGTNALEENGPTAIVAMAQYLSRLPSNALPCTIMVLLTSGHFAGGVGARAFRTNHADDLVLNTNAALTLEHLGAMQWAEEEQSMQPNGHLEWSAVFAPRTKALVEAAYGGLVASNSAPGFVLHPTNEEAPGTPNDAAWPGEGQYLFADGGMPDANYITGPTYLLNWGVNLEQLLNVEHMRAQAIAFTSTILTLTRTPREALRTKDLS